MTDETELNKLKLALQIKDDQYDDLLQLYLDDACDFLKLRLSLDSVPKELQAIVRSVAVKKFNRLGQEGMKSYSQAGESLTFDSSDFYEYQTELKAYKQKLTKTNSGMWCNPYEV